MRLKGKMGGMGLGRGTEGVVTAAPIPRTFCYSSWAFAPDGGFPKPLFKP